MFHETSLTEYKTTSNSATLNNIATDNNENNSTRRFSISIYGPATNNDSPLCSDTMQSRVVMILLQLASACQSGTDLLHQSGTTRQQCPWFGTTRQN